MSPSNFLAMAAIEAQLAAVEGESAVGAIIVKGDEVIAKSHDRRIQHNNPIATAEMECIRLAGRRNDQAELTLYSTAYPDMLTAGTILQFSIGALVIGQPLTSTPAIELLLSKSVPVTFFPANE